MLGPFAGIKMNQKIRYALLAGTMLPAIALPQAGMAWDSLPTPSAEGVIILAQAPAIDPATGKPYPKGTQPQPKAGPALKGPPPGPPPKGPPPGPPPGGAQSTPQGTPQGAQPLQKGVSPKGIQPIQGQQNTQQGGPQTSPQGTPQGAQPLKKSVTPKSIQPIQGQQNTQQGGSQTSPQGTSPQGVQPLQKGVQPKGIQPIQGQQKVLPGGQPATGQGTLPQGVKTQQLGVQQKGIQPLPGPQGAQPLAVTGNVDQLRSQRRERTEAGGRLVIEEPDRRIIVRESGRTIIRHDENARFQLWGGTPRLERRGAEQFTYIGRPGGYQIVNVTDGSGRLLRRIRRGPDGREVIIIDNRMGPGLVGAGIAAAVFLAIAAPVILIPREQYIVDVSVAPAPLLYETLEAPPLVEIERPYTLDEIRYNVALRDRMRRIDIDSVTFDTGSWEVTPEQQPRLRSVAEAILRVISRNPNEVFMIEGHTDAVGNDVDNLSLSDRRAESVAVILTNVYQIPPENLVTQGYGSQHLKIPTDGPSRENRYVAARRITALLQGGVANR